MHLPHVILTLIASLAAIVALTAAPANSSAPPPQAPTPREAALDRLLAERESLKALDSAIANAREQGVGEQPIIEARFLYHVDHRDDAALAAMLPAMLKQRDAFKLEDSAIFATTEDWLAIIEYVQAIAALNKGDQPAFKQHITEAFWLSPKQAAAFAPHIERSRLEQCMRNVTIDFSAKLPPLAPGDPVSLQSLLADKKAMLLHFWTPQSPDCETGMPDFITTAASLSSNGIAVVALLPEASPTILAAARTMIAPLRNKASAAWLIDPKEHPLARTLRIQNLPTMVLVSSAGKILFNGDPSEKEFWETLKKIDARIMRPSSPH